MFHRLKLTASASAPLCPGPDVLLRGEGGDPALLLGIGGGVGGLMATASGRQGGKGTRDVSRDDVSVASSSRDFGSAGVPVHEQQLLHKLHTNILQQQRPAAAVHVGMSAAKNDDSDRGGPGVDVTLRAQATSAGGLSSTAGSSSKVVSWLQASEAAFAEERALFMQNKTTASDDDDDDDDDNEAVTNKSEATLPLPRQNGGNSSRSSSDSVAILGACRVEFERIEMAGGGSLAQPTLLAALRASGTGSMKQVEIRPPNSLPLSI